MPTNHHILSAYNATAENYAKEFMDELSHKHLDRILLRQFAEENKGGNCIDLGCGPGQTTKLLFDCGMNDIVGTDLSPAMITKAKELNPQINFEVADMLNLQYADNSFSSAIAFYAIVHFTMDELKRAFQEIKRVLIQDGHFLFSFHIGNEIKHVDNFLDKNVSLDFYFFETDKIIKLLEEAGFIIVDAIERFPYKDVEYPSKRAYIWVKK
ncbi:MAG TPA: class I SAM-dependent methyltransferase [Bacteroidia bacterium]|jgi:ubiquinone/menaquinone biosynthesis C-methylase UbiE|nr:class I SAM-dependent methyltransferase [Bacteroidia bacterium]